MMGSIQAANQGKRYLIAGLGNPGERYACTRHNVGFWCIDRLSECWPSRRERRRFKALVTEGMLVPHRVILVKPQTFMNDSGDAIAPACRWYKISPDRLLVIHDDLDLPVGRIRLRSGGSSGGHRGVASVIERLGTDGFLRLRIGIGRPSDDDAVDYVLSRFSKDERVLVERIVSSVPEVASCVINEGIAEAMNRYNGLDATDMQSL